MNTYNFVLSSPSYNALSSFAQSWNMTPDEALNYILLVCGVVSFEEVAGYDDCPDRTKTVSSFALTDEAYQVVTESAAQSRCSLDEMVDFLIPHYDCHLQNVIDLYFIEKESDLMLELVERFNLMPAEIALRYQKGVSLLCA